MKTEADIADLVKHIKKGFPQGCAGVNCDQCVLCYAEDGTREHDICKLLFNHEIRVLFSALSV